MRFLLSWGVRIGAVVLLAWVMAHSPFIAAGVWYALLAYLVFAAWSRLRRDLPRLWRLTAFRSLPRHGARIRIGRVKGDTL